MGRVLDSDLRDPFSPQVALFHDFSRASGGTSTHVVFGRLKTSTSLLLPSLTCCLRSTASAIVPPIACLD